MSLGPTSFASMWYCTPKINNAMTKSSING
jgi:hypothetical protein